MIFVFWDEATGRRSGQLCSVYVILGAYAWWGVHVCVMYRWAELGALPQEAWV